MIDQDFTIGYNPFRKIGSYTQHGDCAYLRLLQLLDSRDFHLGKFRSLVSCRGNGFFQ